MVIVARGLAKDFVSYRKQPGLLGSLRAFFRPDPIVKPAVRDFDLEIAPGEIVGLLGPNGAGKTTLMKMLTGIVVPTRGELSVLGFTPFDRAEAFRLRIALVMGQKSQLWWDIPARDSFDLLRAYYQVPRPEFERRLAELAELLGVAEQLPIHLRRLSLGERMKMELIACLLHRPEVLFLDEPTIGLDVVAQDSIRGFLKDWARRYGTTILLTSHYMADVAALCRRIVLILDGEKRFDGPLRDFERLLGSEREVTFTLSEPRPGDPRFEPFDPVYSEEGRRVALRIPEAELREVTARILTEFPVVDFASESLPVERVMKQLLASTRPARSAPGSGEATGTRGTPGAPPPP